MLCLFMYSCYFSLIACCIKQSPNFSPWLTTPASGSRCHEWKEFITPFKIIRTAWSYKMSSLLSIALVRVTYIKYILIESVDFESKLNDGTFIVSLFWLRFLLKRHRFGRHNFCFFLLKYLCFWQTEIDSRN